MTDMFDDGVQERKTAPVKTKKEKSGKGFRISLIDITNNKALKMFHVEPNGNNLEIAGPTGKGKTTAAGALFEAIENQQDAVTHGEEKGLIHVQLSDGSKVLNVRRSLKKNGKNLLSITNEAGGKVEKKDFMKMISDLSVNPHHIMTMKPKERVEKLLSAADMKGFDPEAAEVELDKLRADRLFKKQTLDATGDPGDEPEKVEAQSAAKISEKLSKAEEENRKHSAYADQLNNLMREHHSCSSRIEELKRQIKELESEEEGLFERIEEGKKVVSKMPQHDTTALIEELKSVDETNEKAKAWERWQEDTEKREAASEAWKTARDLVITKEKAKKDALEKATFPLEGLSFEDGDVVYNGCLLQNLGESEQLLVCCALASKDIKEVKVVLVDGCESMSVEDYEKMKKLFNDDGIQLLSTRVSRGDVEPHEITIEDGTFDDRETE